MTAAPDPVAAADGVVAAVFRQVAMNRFEDRVHGERRLRAVRCLHGGTPRGDRLIDVGQLPLGPGDVLAHRVDRSARVHVVEPVEDPLRVRDATVERGALQQVGIYEREPFQSYFSGNTI